MAILVALNGPPGIGKTTLANRYAAEHPLALALDLDLVRGQIGTDLDQPDAAWFAARDLVAAMARTHLSAGHDVVVSQYLGRPEFLDRLAAVAVDVGVPFVEAVLMDHRAAALERFAVRGGDVHLGPEFYDRLRDMLPDRPAAQVIWTDDGAVDAAYQELLRVVGDRRHD